MANDERLKLGEASILKPTVAAELLPVRESTGMEWLRSRSLIRRVAGLGEVVIWGDVIKAIRDDAGGTVVAATNTRPLKRAAL